MVDQYKPSFIKSILQSVRARGIWGGISMIMLLGKIRSKGWFGANHKAITNLSVLGLFALSIYAAYWALTKHGVISSGLDVWGITILFAAALAGGTLSISHFMVQEVFRRQILMKIIQFSLFSLVVGFLGFIGYDAWVVLYAKQPAEATLLAVIAAVVLYGLSDVTALVARSSLVKTMSVANMKEIPSLSAEGKYRAGIHEAGHALCYALCNGVPEDAYVVIEEDMNELIGGRVNLPEPREPTDFARPHIEWEMLMVMAGVAAEEEIFGDGSMLGGGDMASFNLHATIYLMAGHGEVFAMEPENELAETTNRAAIGRLREEYRLRARSFIKANRELVESMARELCEIDFMDCERIAARVAQVTKPEGHVMVSWPASLSLVQPVSE